MRIVLYCICIREIKMSRHNYTNPAFCQQSEYYPSSPPAKESPSTVNVHRSESIRSAKTLSTNAKQRITTRAISNGNLQQQRFQRQHSNHELPPRPGPKPAQINLTTRYPDKDIENIPPPNRNGGSKPDDRYALVPVSEISSANKGRYAVIPATDSQRLIRSSSTRFSKSQDSLDRIDPIHTNDNSFTSLPPSNRIDEPTKLKSAFSSDFGNKSLILLDQKSMQRYAIVPTEDDEELVDANHEIIQMHNGRAHRYAVIPTEDEDDDEETCLSSELELTPRSSANNNYATIKDVASYYKTPPQKLYTGSSSSLKPPQKNNQQQLMLTPQKMLTTPTKSALATQKLHEILSTPRKTPLQRQNSRTSSAHRRYHSQIISSTPKYAGSDYSVGVTVTPQTHQQMQHPNGEDPYRPASVATIQQQFTEQRTTAVISPRLASLADYSETSSVQSKAHSTFEKVKNATATIGAISLMLTLSGSMNSALCLYMIASVSIYFQYGIYLRAAIFKYFRFSQGRNIFF